jgi:hypothetical protein
MKKSDMRRIIQEEVQKWEHDRKHPQKLAERFQRDFDTFNRSLVELITKCHMELPEGSKRDNYKELILEKVIVNHAEYCKTLRAFAEILKEND